MLRTSRRTTISSPVTIRFCGILNYTKGHGYSSGIRDCNERGHRWTTAKEFVSRIGIFAHRFDEGNSDSSLTEIIS